MANKYRGLEPLEPGSPPAEPVVLKPTEGLRSDVSPREIRPGDSPDLEDVRFERSAIRKDFGWSPIGAAAASRVLGILEHKFIEENQTFHRLARFRRVNSQCRIEVWDGVNWINEITSEETIQDVYLSLVSSQGCIYVADGTVILEWCEITPTTLQENDFPSANSLTAVGEETQATVSPGDPGELDYSINYDVEITDNPGTTDYTITLEFYHGVELLGSKTYTGKTTDAFPLAFDNESFEFNKQISDTEIVKIKVASESGGLVVETDGPMGFVGGSPPEFEIAKTPAEEDVEGSLLFKYQVTISSGTITVGFYTFDGTSWTQESTRQHSTGGAKETPVVPSVDLNDPGAKFGFHVEAESDPANDAGQVDVEWSYKGGTFSVHGHNKATDLDDPAGVTYTTVGEPASQFQEVSPDAPDARFILPFADRLLAMRDGGDHQSLAWSADGVLTDWAGGDSGQIFLVDSRSDPIDDLMSGAVLADNFVALFRKRSIMRVFETGNVLQAIAAVPWIENLGTASPFSVQNVIGGAIFLGHDLQVYYLTTDGPRPIGDPIHQELVEDLTGRLDLVDSGHDAIFAEYYLGIPVDGATSISKVWVFDVDRFVKNQETVWRRRPMNVERFGSASEIE